MQGQQKGEKTEQVAKATEQEVEEEFTEEQAQKFNQICKQAAQLAQDYQRQSQDLKTEMVEMVNVYNKNRDPGQAVPVEKIISITKEYQEGMKEAQSEYEVLSGQLKIEEEERSEMMGQIHSCFEKLERMEKILVQKKRKETEQKKSLPEGQGQKVEAKVQVVEKQ